MCIPFIRSATSVGVIPEPLWCVRHVQGFRVVGLRSGLKSSVIRGHDGRVFFFRPQLAQKCLACATKSAMEEQRHGSRSLQEGHDEVEAALLRRLDALERRVFGRSVPCDRDAQPLATKVEAISKSVSRAEGGSRDLDGLAAQASDLGLLSTAPSATLPVGENVAMKERLLLAARGEIEATAGALALVKKLQEHVNPPYLKDVPEWNAMLSGLNGTYIGQATEAARINESAENVRLHYCQAVNLISEKFVHWDDQVAELERQRASRP